MTVIPDSRFGERVRERLRTEELVWLTTTSADGTPQPNPVWFLWEPDADAVVLYSRNHAARLTHIAFRPRVSLNFQADAGGGDVVVISGVAEQALDIPSVDQHAAYLEKYARGIDRIGANTASLAQEYSVALRVRFTKVRGF